jgi:hypothetical protein
VEVNKKEKPSLSKEGFLAVNRCMNKNNLCYITIYTAGVKKVTPPVKKIQENFFILLNY